MNFVYISSVRGLLHDADEFYEMNSDDIRSVDNKPGKIRYTFLNSSREVLFMTPATYFIWNLGKEYVLMPYGDVYHNGGIVKESRHEQHSTCS